MAILALLLGLWFGGAGVLRAEEPEASATLSESTTGVGEPVQYQITVSGARRAQMPDQIRVDGLDINYTGQSTQVQMHNFDMKMSVVFTYTIVPRNPGTFTIPAQTVEAGGRRLVTNALTLNVRAGSGGARSGGEGTGGKTAFAEVIIPKERAYVGEAIPVELRVYVDSRVRWQLENPPQLQGEGFSTQKLSDPVQNQVIKEGREYDLVIFKTAISPARTGTLSVGPFELNTVAQIPQQRRARPRFGIDDFDALFNDPFGAFAQTQKLSIKSEAATLQVRPLPPNAPKSFAGAVGQFAIETAANPVKVKIGEPVTLTVKVSGRGNFDRVGAPQLNEPGWRSYPASGTFKADDNVGISGTKTFEMAVIPEDQKGKSPPVEFTYFDPVAEKYVTLTGEQFPLIVDGERAVAAPLPSPPASQPPSAAAPAQVVAANDIHYIRTDSGKWGVSFQPLHHRREFWLAQSVPLLALIGFIGWRRHQEKARDLKAKYLGELRRQKAEAMRTLHRDDVDAAMFYDAAAKVIQAETALHSHQHQTAAAIDATAALGSRRVEDEVAARIRNIFDARAEALYAGHGGAGKVSAREREEVLEAIGQFERAYV